MNGGMGMVQTELELEKTFLGIELGSTRIKAVLIDSNHIPLANGEFAWENRFENGMWTYCLDDVWSGLQSAYQELFNDIKEKYGVSLTKVGSIGFSAMMHGYLPFDSEGKQLAPFRTWRNTTTNKAAEALSSLFQFNIPLRWSVAHLYQAILDEEEHVKDISFLTTLAGYVHWKLTGKKVLGVGDAAGMFPIDPETTTYDNKLVEKFNALTENHHFNWTLKSVFPEVLEAGANAGYLTEEGVKLLDPTGLLESGVPLCPPEGDAGTGMVATNSVAEHTGNVSAGTSIFSMTVLDKPLGNYYSEIDIVTTPDGKPVAMVHCNNFTSDINAWMNMFKEVYEVIGTEVDMGELFTLLFKKAMDADDDVGGLVNCNYYSGEPITDFEEGRPLFVRMPDSKLTLANFMKTHIYSALATLKIGMDILTTEEKVKIDYILGHGGFFKTENVGQQLMADALLTPVSLMENAGEGGAWGMALLAAYSSNNDGRTLEEYLNEVVFAKEEIITLKPSEKGVESFTEYMERYKAVLKVEKAAVNVF